MGVWEEQARRANQYKKLWSAAQEFVFVDALSNAANEEEVKAAYVREFSLPVKTPEKHDLVVDKVLFEFKYSVNLSNIEVAAKVVAQAIYYINRLHKKGRIGEVNYLILADKDEARIFRISDFQLFYESQAYQWDSFRPSSPDPDLIEAVKNSRILESNRVYRLTSLDDLHLFSSRLYKILFPNKTIEESSRKATTIYGLPRAKVLIISFVVIVLTSGLAIGSKFYFLNDSSQPVPTHRQ